MRRHHESIWKSHEESLAAKAAANGRISKQATLDNFTIRSDGKVLSLCVDMIIEGARPFSMFDDASMRALTELALKGADEKGKICITGAKVRESVIERAKIKRKDIIANPWSKTSST